MTLLGDLQLLAFVSRKCPISYSPKSLLSLHDIGIPGLLDGVKQLFKSRVTEEGLIRDIPDPGAEDDRVEGVTGQNRTSSALSAGSFTVAHQNGLRAKSSRDPLDAILYRNQLVYCSS